MDKRILFSGIAVLVLGLGFAVWSLNRGYGEVGERGYELSLALLSACNRQDSQQLDAVEKLINEAHAAQEVTSKENSWLQNVVQLARKKKWRKAAIEVRQLMKDQVVDSEPLPKLE